MDKSLSYHDYTRFLSLLREVRLAAGLTQHDLADKLDQTQSFISKCERGERRIDIIELRAFCKALDISLSEFILLLEKALER